VIVAAPGRELLSEGRRPALPDSLTLRYLCQEIVHAEASAAIWQRHGVFDKADWWLDYLDHLHEWHWDWIRHLRPRHLQLCPSCGRLMQHDPGWLRCFACGQAWLR
jgi:hypothetical protein